MQLPYYPCQSASDPSLLAELKDIDKTLGVILIFLGVWLTLWCLGKLRERLGERLAMDRHAYLEVLLMEVEQME